MNNGRRITISEIESLLKTKAKLNVEYLDDDCSIRHVSDVISATHLIAPHNQGTYFGVMHENNPNRVFNIRKDKLIRVNGLIVAF